MARMQCNTGGRDQNIDMRSNRLRLTRKLVDWRLLQPMQPYQWLTAAWLLAMIAIPIMSWVIGDAVLPWGVMASVFLLTSAVLGVLRQTWGAWRTLRMTAIILPTAWLLEWIGSTTGFLFGHYHYTNLLQPQLGHVPVIIPLAWLMMLPPAWAVASVIMRGHTGLWFIMISALALTAWDLFLDPQMANWGYWVWEQPGGYFGIPWLNFLGWAMSAALLTVLVQPKAVPVQPLLLIYVITWILQTIGQLCFWHMPGSALVGFLAMGSLLLLALASATRTPSSLQAVGERIS
jgi:uncharacterized membrane protein